MTSVTEDHTHNYGNIKGILECMFIPSREEYQSEPKRLCTLALRENTGPC